MTTAIVWFRNDLRLHDNPALLQAARKATHLIALYIDEAADDPWPPGAASRWWLHHSLEALDASLQSLGNRLHCIRGDPRVLLRELVDRSGAVGLHANRRHTPHGEEMDRQIQAQLSPRGIDLQLHDSGVLNPPEALLNQQGRPYKVFTPYYRAALARGLDDFVQPAPERLPPPPRGIQGPGPEALGYLPAHPWAEGLGKHWTPGEAAARQTLEHFIETGLRDYPQQRDLPAVDGTSHLSAHLHFGELSPRELLRRLRQTPWPASGEVIRQLLWRDFAHAVLHHFPHTSDQAFNDRFTAFPWQKRANKALKAWQQGRTGIPIVDAGMRELWQTGYMHNRVRMLAGSFLTKNLMLHWRLGARWFWDTLVDADLAQNSMNWQWVAGCGVDAAPYFRIFNPVSQGEKFDARGDYVRRWVPELARLDNKWIHKPWEAGEDTLKAAGIRLGRDYPRPLVDLKQSRQDALAAYRALK